MRNIKLFMVFFVFAFLILSCSKDEIIYPEANVEVAKTYLSLDKLADNPVELSSKNGTYVLKVFSDKKWKVTSSEGWCTLSTKEGFKYVEVPINFSDNPWNIDRTAQLNFTVPETNETFVLNVTQVAAETRMEVDKAEMVYGVGGGVQTVSLRTNANEWNVKITDVNGSETPDVDWCQLDEGSATSGKGSKEIGFKVSGNSTNVVRYAKIIFTAEDQTVEIPVSQLEKFDAPKIEVDDASLNLTWDEIVGVKYKLKITESGDGSELITKDFDGNITSCNLSELDWKDYVGKVKIQLFATMSINGEDKIQPSNIIEVHNYFDISSGEGTSESPYIISNQRHLMNIGSVVGKNKFFKQSKDISLTDENFIALCPNGFDGTFNGDKKIISGLKINASGATDNIGLFAKINATGCVQNVILDKVSITAIGGKTGAISAYSEGKIEGCTVSGEIVSSQNVTSPVGGLVGYNKKDILSCVNNMTINVTSKSIGGVCGLSEGGTIKQCGNNGNITSNKANVGGIVGELKKAMIVEECYNKGNIISLQSVGGIVGGGNNTTKINNSYNTGNIESTAGDDKSKACGIYSWSNAVHPTIVNCYNVGNVVVPAGKTANAISNQAPAENIANCFFLVGTASNMAQKVEGSGTTEADMKNKGTYVNWDFSNVWTMSVDGYPKLNWEK